MIKISRPNLQPSDLERVAQVLSSGQLVYGSYAREFETVFARHVQAPYALLVSSGTAALHLSLLALGIGEGDHVLVPNYTFPATVNVVKRAGATPVLVDVDPRSYVMTSTLMTEALDRHPTPAQVKAVIPVHEFGYPALMTELNEVASAHQLSVIEDAACAIGAHLEGRHVGTFGDVGCFSFHPRKIITSGEGGLIVTHREDIARRVARLRSHGIERADDEVHFKEAGLNYRLTDFQAALLQGQYERLPQWIKKRADLAQLYSEHLSPLESRYGIKRPAFTAGRVWQSYVIELPRHLDARVITKALLERGIETNCGAQVLSHIQHMRAEVTEVERGFYSHRSMHHHTLALPLCELYTPQVIDEVSSALQAVLRERAQSR